jgi:hypothetical protein
VLRKPRRAGLTRRSPRMSGLRCRNGRLERGREGPFVLETNHGAALNDAHPNSAAAVVLLPDQATKVVLVSGIGVSVAESDSVVSGRRAQCQLRAPLGQRSVERNDARTDVPPLLILAPYASSP